MSAARDAMLAALRRGSAGEAPPLPEVRTSARDEVPPLAERVATFSAMLAKLGATAEVVRDVAHARERVAAILAQHDASSIACSDHALVRDVVRGLPAAIEQLPHDTPKEQLLAAHAGLSTAQFGVAETGTLALASADERHRLASLLPDLHVALLPCDRLLATLGDAFAKLAPDGRPTSPTITFVTGPSRTADIELELVVGVHGPKNLHVLLLESA